MSTIRFRFEVFRTNEDESTETVLATERLNEALEELTDDPTLQCDVWEGEEIVYGLQEYLLMLAGYAENLVEAIQANRDDSRHDENGNWEPTVKIQYISEELEDLATSVGVELLKG